MIILLFLLLLAVVLVALFKCRQHALENSSHNASYVYRQHEKQHAIRSMSIAMREQAALLGEGDVIELEYYGDKVVIIMDETARVYEWNGTHWVDGWPDKMFVVQKNNE